MSPRTTTAASEIAAALLKQARLKKQRAKHLQSALPPLHQALSMHSSTINEKQQASKYGRQDDHATASTHTGCTAARVTQRQINLDRKRNGALWFVVALSNRSHRWSARHEFTEWSMKFVARTEAVEMPAVWAISNFSMFEAGSYTPKFTPSKRHHRIPTGKGVRRKWALKLSRSSKFVN
jgi:uncharacterized protein YfiM (DUF2279 family)